MRGNNWSNTIAASEGCINYSIEPLSTTCRDRHMHISHPATCSAALHVQGGWTLACRQRVWYGEGNQVIALCKHLCIYYCHEDFFMMNWNLLFHHLFWTYFVSSVPLFHKALWLHSTGHLSAEHVIVMCSHYVFGCVCISLKAVFERKFMHNNVF